MLVDTHCHLDAKEFNDDREAVIERAIQAGVTTMISIGTGLPVRRGSPWPPCATPVQPNRGWGDWRATGTDGESCRAVIALAERHPQVWAAVGIDPFDAGDVNRQTLAELRELAQHPRVVAIGEIGLDYHWDTHPRDVQRRAFEAQLQLAADLGKPVIIHNREAHEDTLSILRAWVRSSKSPVLSGRTGEVRSLKSAVRSLGSAVPGQLEKAVDLGLRTMDLGLPGVMHCFSGGPALALALAELGFVISLAGPLTFLNARKPPEVARAVPLDYLVVETDAPWLSPHPFRGKRNEPARVRLVAEKLAEVKGLSFEEVASTTTANARRLFRLPELSHD